VLGMYGYGEAIAAGGNHSLAMEVKPPVVAPQ
jgi:hypothetical protein